MRCVATRSDDHNCGSCGQRCASGQVCSAGTCATTCVAGLPEAVLTLPDGTLTVSYERVLPLLVEAFKAEDTRVEQLERRLEKLETRR